MFNLKSPWSFIVPFIGLIILIAILFNPAQHLMCSAIGGKWYTPDSNPDLNSGNWSLPQYQCVMPFSDANKQCSDGVDCLGICLAPEHTAPGMQVTGKCSRWPESINGCETIITNGVAGTICE